MKTQKTQFDKQRQGSALILVIVVTVLLAVIGVMFLMVSRVAEMETAVVATNKDLDAAVDTVVARINDVLVEDLFGQSRPANNVPFQLQDDMLNADDIFAGYDLLNIHADESYDYPMHNSDLDPGPDGNPGTADDTPYIPGVDGAYETPDDLPIPSNLDDFWLASLEPVFAGVGPDSTFGTADDIYQWPHITDLWGTLQVQPHSLLSQSYYSTLITPNFWLDPDDETDPTQWAAGAAVWDYYKVSAENVRTKVITSQDRMNVIQQGSLANITAWDDPTNTWAFGARADADGDGVADSRWVQIPNITTSRGKPVYAAVRIIDNCAMLNLNAAHCFYQADYSDNTSFFEKAWYENDLAATPEYHDNQSSGSGRFLSEINYLPFLRGFDLNGNAYKGTESGDDWYSLVQAKGFWDSAASLPHSPESIHAAFMNIENPGDDYPFFDLSDELELRNRYLVTSPVESRFEQSTVANFTLDAGGGTYGAFTTPIDDLVAFTSWKIKNDQRNFDAWSGTVSSDDYRYDRRHVCTFYSYDRVINKGVYPLLTYDFNQLVSAASWTPSQIEDVEKIFLPKGPVATDISHGVLNGTTGQWELNYNNIETRRKIVHLLFALRAYYLLQIDPNYETMDFSSLTAAQQTQLNTDLRDAALKAAQIVANIIDYSDDDAPNSQLPGETEGPFYNTLYGEQANADCTFITEQIIADIITELSEDIFGPGNGIAMSFGLNATDMIFGYERQPFITEVYANRDATGNLTGFAIELINPYTDNLPLYRPDGDGFNANVDAWRIKVTGGTGISEDIAGATTAIPGYDPGTDVYGRYVIRSSNSNVTLGTGYSAGTYELPELLNMGSGNLEIQLLRPAPANSGVDYIVVDMVEDSVVQQLWNQTGESAVKRVETDWQFIYADESLYEFQKSDDGSYTNTLGLPTGVLAGSMTGLPDGFQMGSLDDGLPLTRMHDLEVLAWFGNAPEDDPNNAITKHLFDAGGDSYFDLTDPTENVTDYISTLNRPEEGTLPGRININTAPVHVIAAAIPPVLADPNAADPTNKTVTFSALDLAQAIVTYRNTNGPYKQLSDLLNVPGFKQYTTGGDWEAENVGTQSIDDDIEEEHWVLSNLANKFTVRSDVFTAYILVRLGEDGPQRRMIAIFDRSNVWDVGDRPKLVALHPVPDPR